jgi:hypothetical protein
VAKNPEIRIRRHRHRRSRRPHLPPAGQVTTQILMTGQYQNARPFHKFGKPFSIVKVSSFLECFANEMLIKLKPDDPESLQVVTS